MEKWLKKVEMRGIILTWAVNLPYKSEFIKENIDEIIFMFALFKCRKSDKGRN